MSKRYYWLKLQNNFFTQPRIKKLRNLAGGDTYTIIYLEMQLLSLENNGVLIFEGIEDDFVSEIALTLNEDVENVRFTIMYLLKQGLIQEVEEDEYTLIETIKNIGSETASAIEMRKKRKGSQCDSNVTTMLHNVQKSDVEIEIEKDKEIEIEKDKEIESENRDKSIDIDIKDSKEKNGFKKPTLLEIQNYISENNLNVNAEKWLDYYQSNGWKVGRNPMKDWKACVRRWNKTEMNNHIKENRDREHKPVYDTSNNPEVDQSLIDALYEDDDWRN